MPLSTKAILIQRSLIIFEFRPKLCFNRGLSIGNRSLTDALRPGGGVPSNFLNMDQREWTAAGGHSGVLTLMEFLSVPLSEK